MRWATGDLFEAASTPPPSRPAKKLPGQRLHPKLSPNARSARPASDKERGVDGVVYQHVLGNGALGVTRNELHFKTGFSIQTLCYSIDRLFKSGRIFRRQDTTADVGRLRFISRARCYLLYADNYRDYFARNTPHPPYDEPPPAARSA